ncbi:MAG: choice-of-anchor X domain-containing protein [Gammaproteobacteria bacterium]|nr:choice-of-anchor X domain-containing protein [Gammaproteobacteria bacterium]
MTIRMNILLLLALPLSVQAGESGPLAHGAMPEPGKAGPAHESRLFVGSTRITNGQAALDLPIDTPENAVLVVFDEQPLAVRAPQAGGPHANDYERRLPARGFDNPALASMDVPAVGSRIALDSLPAQSNRLTVESARKSGQLRYAVMQPDSPVAMTVQARPLATQSGKPLTLTAQLPADAQAEVVARIRGVGKVALRDDGQGADLQAGDGIHTAMFAAPKVQGMREIVMRVDASGELGTGSAFRRTTSARSMVSESRISLSQADVRVDADALEFSLAATGRYRIEAVFGRDGQALAFAREQVGIEKSRNRPNIRLPRPPSAAAANEVVIRVLDMESMGLAAELSLPLTPQASTATMSAEPAIEMPASKRAAAREHSRDRF